MTSFLSESPAFSNIVQQLQGSSVLVIGHRRPDGDCIGSQVAMTRTLRNLGVNAIAVNNDPVPRTLQKFIGDTPFVRPSEIKEDQYRIVTVDCADHSRVGDDLRNRYPEVFINVDHHVSNTNFAEHNFVLSDASATGEILAKFFFDRIMRSIKPLRRVFILGFVRTRASFVIQVPMPQFLKYAENFVTQDVIPQMLPTSFMKKKSQVESNFCRNFWPVSKWNLIIGYVLAVFGVITMMKPERNLRMPRIL